MLDKIFKLDCCLSSDFDVPVMFFPGHNQTKIHQCVATIFLYSPKFNKLITSHEMECELLKAEKEENCEKLKEKLVQWVD